MIEVLIRVGCAPRHVLALDFSPEAYERLEEIRLLAGCANYAELLQRALPVLEWWEGEKREGINKIALLKNGTIENIFVMSSV